LQFALEQTLQDIDEAVRLDQLRAIKERSMNRLAPQAGWADHEQFAFHDGLNLMHDHMIRRVIRLAESRLRMNGLSPPCSYSFVLFGSGGRGEQSVFSDQDNGIIYDNVSPSGPEACDRYFRTLGITVQEALQTVGYPPCAGKVSCGYSSWSRPLNEWLKQLGAWSEDPTWEHVRYLLIWADMRPVYGDERLADRAASYFRARAGGNKELMTAMLQNTRYRRPVVGPFGNLRRVRYGPHAGGIEIKYNVYLPIVSVIRLLSILYRIEVSSTERRIRQLEKKGVLPRHMADRVLKDWAGTLYLRAIAAVEEQNDVKQSSGIVEAKQLTKPVLRRLKSCLATVKTLQRLAEREVKRFGRFGLRSEVP